MNPSKATTAAAVGMIPPRLVIKAVPVYAENFFTPLVVPESVPESRFDIYAGSKSVPPIKNEFKNLAANFVRLRMHRPRMPGGSKRQNPPV